jgi:hypothetical protein
MLFEVVRCLPEKHLNQRLTRGLGRRRGLSGGQQSGKRQAQEKWKYPAHEILSVPFEAA